MTEGLKFFFEWESIGEEVLVAKYGMRVWTQCGQPLENMKTTDSRKNKHSNSDYPLGGML